MENIALRLRAALDAAGFTAQRVEDLIGPAGRFHIQSGETVPLQRRLRSTAALTILTRLFVAELSCSVHDAETALGSSDLQSWVDGGVLQVSGDEVISLMAIDWFGDLLVAFDARRLRSRPDYVMGPSGPTAALAGLTIRTEVATTLDIGCGSGLQALLAAAHSASVKAYDINQRAVHLTRFNSALNGISNIQAQQADLFNFPSADVNADLVVSNPPYVISPGLSHQYRDSGRQGDEVCRHLAALIPRLLARSGIGQFMANWAVTTTESWRDRVAGWFKNSGCDVWILHETTEEASSYVANWLRETDATALKKMDHRYERWMNHFHEQRIIGVGYGLVTMQRRSQGCENVWIDDAPDTYIFPCSESLATFLARRRSALTTADLLTEAWRPSRQLVIDITKKFGNGLPNVIDRRVRSIEGLGWSQALTAQVCGVIEACDGKSTLEEIILTQAQQWNETAASLLSKVMPDLRLLIERGFLVCSESSEGLRN